MKLDVEATRINMVEVYAGIGSQVPLAESRQVDGDFSCRSSIGFPIGNFSILNGLEPDSLGRAVDFARPGATTYIYSFAGQEVAADDRLAQTFGLQHSGHLATLAHPCAEEVCPTNDVVRLVPVRDPDRRSAATLIAEEFFPRYDSKGRALIVDATARSPIELLWILADLEEVGAMMVHETEACFGIYNFCIRRDFRGRGFGSNAVRIVCREARSNRKFACLQCDSSLEDWYFSLDFVVVDEVEVWRLDKFSANPLL